MSGSAADAQASFAAALLGHAPTVPPGLRVWNGSDAGVRLAVHRNTVVASLVQALADGFPVVHRTVGDAFFRAMAREYVREQPPRSPVLADYGDDFAAWVAGFAPAATLAYLPDLARLERARVRAWHAADAPILDPATLVRRLEAADALAGRVLALQPSVTPLVSAFGVVSWWAAHQQTDDAAIGAVALERAESALVLRDGDAVLVLPVSRAQAVFAHALRAAMPLGDAVASATGAADADAPFDLAAALQLLLRHAALVA